jgi:hypothetical protein
MGRSSGIVKLQIAIPAITAVKVAMLQGIVLLQSGV